MENKRYLLDTNALIALLSGNFQIVSLLNDAEWIGISILNQLEFLSYKNLSDRDTTLFLSFIKRIEVIDVAKNNQDLLEYSVKIRQKSKLKLADAVIAATAIINNTAIVTRDNDFSAVENLSIIRF